jgi:hypothetical protein
MALNATSPSPQPPSLSIAFPFLSECGSFALLLCVLIIKVCWGRSEVTRQRGWGVWGSGLERWVNFVFIFFSVASAAVIVFRTSRGVVPFGGMEWRENLLPLSDKEKSAKSQLLT